MGEFFYSFDDEMKKSFGGKVYRLALSASHSCPNRDGSAGTGGCIFCSAGGSGDFAESHLLDIDTQIERAKERVSRKLSRSFAGYMAYFQSFTETYGDEEYLAGCFERAEAHPEILCLSVATRPDSISEPMLDRLAAINNNKPVYVELGLQTVHEDTAEYINRCYRLSVFEEAFARLKAAGLKVVVHVIVGLPGEDEERTTETVRYLSQLEYKGQHIDGIKLQLMHILKGTELAARFPAEASEDTGSIFFNDGMKLTCYNISSYAELITKLVAILPGDIAVHRITGDAPKSLLIYPKWSADKKRVLNTITKTFIKTGRRQSDGSILKQGV